MKKKTPLAASKVPVRNRVVQNPLIRKGGVHQQSHKSKRQAQKLAIAKREFERDAVFTAVGSSSFLWAIAKEQTVNKSQSAIAL